MLKTLIAPVAAAFAVLLLAGTAEPSQAAGRDHSSYSGGSVRSYSAPRVQSHAVRSYAYAGQRYYSYKHVRHFNRHRSVIVGVPVYGVYAYSDDCYWLRRKARITGSSYWWNRYYACTDGDYY